MPTFEQPSIIWTSHGVPKSQQFDDYYFNEDGGLDESQFVFLRHNQLSERWSALSELPAQHRLFTVAETGFGTGLNFLAAWALWNATAPSDATLHYVALEKFPLERADIAQALSRWPSLSGLLTELLAQYPEPLERPVNRLTFNQGRLKLSLIFADATAGLTHLAPAHNCANAVRRRACHYSESPRPVDAWFLDGFSPAKNPDMWTPKLFDRMAALSDNGTSVSTFTSASDVRRGLQAVGFNVQRTPGFGRKREMLAGHFVAGAAQSTSNALNDHLMPSAPHSQPETRTRATRQNARAANTPKPSWHLVGSNLNAKALGPPTLAAEAKRVAIIGAGLAGAHTAYALAQRGFRVTVFDAKSIASGASGNPQGVVYTRFSHQHDALAEFNHHAFNYADAFYQHTGYGAVGQRCGVLHLSQGPKHAATQQRIAQRYIKSPEAARWIDASHNLLLGEMGLAAEAEGLFTPAGGWLRPAALCRRLLDHAHIKVHENTPVTALDQKNDGTWQLSITMSQSDGQQDSRSDSFTADIVVVANAYAATEFSQTRSTPIKAIRGQMTFADLAQPTDFPLATCLCGEGYIAPPVTLAEGPPQLCFGATFDLGRKDSAVQEADNQKNIAMISELSAPKELPPLHNIQGRVSFRGATRDYLPIVGPVPDEAATVETKKLKDRNSEPDADTVAVLEDALE
ncbi:MAG TPA: FAD-dependent 5-carboxymethylaminomethyl-2-thiouridine(34) oxidoreductase MnmC, partial [Marinagarivorans sp.]